MSDLSSIATRKSEYRMAVVGILAFCAAVVMVWQWAVTMRELDALAAGEASRFVAFKPKIDVEETP